MSDVPQHFLQEPIFSIFINDNRRDSVNPQQVCRWHQNQWCRGYNRGKECHLEVTWKASGMVPSENLNIKQGQVQGPVPGMRHSISTDWGMNGFRVFLQRSTWVYWWYSKYGHKTAVCLQSSKLITSWDSFKKAWPADWGKWFSPSTVYLWDRTSILGSALGFPFQDTDLSKQVQRNNSKIKLFLSTPFHSIPFHPIPFPLCIFNVSKVQ